MKCEEYKFHGVSEGTAGANPSSSPNVSNVLVTHLVLGVSMGLPAITARYGCILMDTVWSDTHGYGNQAIHLLVCRLFHKQMYFVYTLMCVEKKNWFTFHCQNLHYQKAKLMRKTIKR